MSRKGKYIYGIIRNGQNRNDWNKVEMDPGPIGTGHNGEEVHLVSYKDITALVSDFSVLRFDSIPRETLFRYLVSHQSTLEQAMKLYGVSPVIPMKFGTVAEDEKDVQNILKQGYYQFRTALDSMEGKIELDVVALWRDLNSVLREVSQEEGIKKLKEDMAARPPDQACEARIRLGKIVKAALDGRRETCAARILDILKQHSLAFRPNVLKDDFMIMNVAFLVREDREKEFDQKVNEMNQGYDDRIDFRCVGPLPPYSFSTVEIRRIGLETVDSARKMLGLGDEATMFQIREAYRKSAREFHPDKAPNGISLDISAQFEKISEAYKVLTDYCQHYAVSFGKRDVRNSIAVTILKPAEEMAGPAC